MKDKQIKYQLLQEIKKDINKVDKALKENLDPYLDICKEVASHLLFAGGKRIRPLLFILSARICGRDDVDVIKTSTLFEFLHTASLLHDDLIDEAKIRRSKQSAHLKYGNAISTLVGDFLFAKAMSLACKTQKIEIIEILSNITEKMSQGEIYQLISKKNISLSVEEYLCIISKKTAYLIEGSCKAGAIFAGREQKEIEALANYGLNIGIAFQMVDDILDYNADEKKIGKAKGVDLKEGKVTLPLIYTLEKANKKEKHFIKNLIEKENITETKKLNDIIETYDGFNFTKEKTKMYIKEAKKELDIFEDSKTKNTLLKIADYVLSRKT